MRISKNGQQEGEKDKNYLYTTRNRKEQPSGSANFNQVTDVIERRQLIFVISIVSAAVAVGAGDQANDAWEKRSQAVHASGSDVNTHIKWTADY